MWDNRIRSLELQALEPLKAKEEMRGDAYAEADAVDHVVARLQAIPEYVTLFRNAFGTTSAIDAQQLGSAIAAFERTLVAMNSPFDRFLAGEGNALTDQQRRGMDTFDEVGCDRCHEGPMFSDFDLHAEGVRENPKLAEPDPGTRRFRFRTPRSATSRSPPPTCTTGCSGRSRTCSAFTITAASENPNVVNRRDDDDDDNEGLHSCRDAFAGSMT